MLWQVTRWGLSINKLVLLLKYTEAYVLCISLLYGAEWVICSWLKWIFELKTLVEEEGDFECDLVLIWAALTIGKIQQIWMMGVKMHLMWSSPETVLPPEHKRREVLKYFCRAILSYVVNLCRAVGCGCSTAAGWTHSRSGHFLFLKSQDLFFPSQQPLNSSNDTVWPD